METKHKLSVKEIHTLGLRAAMQSGRRQKLKSMKIFDMLLEAMVACSQEHDQQGHALDDLLSLYVKLADMERDEKGKDGIECLAGSDAERVMMDAYIEGYKHQSGVDVTEAVNSGNSGWYWPEALSYDSNREIYPVKLCKTYGFIVGYQDAIDTAYLRKVYKEMEAERANASH